MSAQDEHIANLAKQGKKVVKQDKYINNSDLLFKGCYLGYDWNTIGGWIQRNGVHGEDGAGYTYISEENEYSPQEFQNIITAILDEAQDTELKVIDD